MTDSPSANEILRMAIEEAECDVLKAARLLAEEVHAQVERSAGGFYRNINQSIRAPKARPKSIE